MIFDEGGTLVGKVYRKTGTGIVFPASVFLFNL